MSGASGTTVTPPSLLYQFLAMFYPFPNDLITKKDTLPHMSNAPMIDLLTAEEHFIDSVTVL